MQQAAKGSQLQVRQNRGEDGKPPVLRKVRVEGAALVDEVLRQSLCTQKRASRESFGLTLSCGLSYYSPRCCATLTSHGFLQIASTAFNCHSRSVTFNGNPNILFFVLTSNSLFSKQPSRLGRERRRCACHWPENEDNSSQGKTEVFCMLS